MNALLTGPDNPFDLGHRINNDHLKALRDAVLDLSVRLKELELKAEEPPKKKRKDD